MRSLSLSIFLLASAAMIAPLLIAMAYAASMVTSTLFFPASPATADCRAAYSAPRIRDLRRQLRQLLGHPVDHLIARLQMSRHGDEGAVRFIDGRGIPRSKDRVEIVLDLRRDASAAEPGQEQEEHSDSARKDDQQGYRQVCHLFLPCYKRPTSLIFELTIERPFFQRCKPQPCDMMFPV